MKEEEDATNKHETTIQNVVLPLVALQNNHKEDFLIHPNMTRVQISTV